MLSDILAADPHEQMTLALWSVEFALSALVLLTTALKLVGGLIAMAVDGFHRRHLRS
jgi:hypothetical protein